MALPDLRALRVRIPLLIAAAAVSLAGLGFVLSLLSFRAQLGHHRLATRAAMTSAFELTLLPVSLALAFTALVALLLDRWLREPAQKLERTAQRLAEGDWSARSGLTGGSELDRVGQAMDRMAQELDAAHRELLASRERLESVLHAMPLGIVLLERGTGRVLLVNDHWRRVAIDAPSAGASFPGHLAERRFFRPDGTPLEQDELATHRALKTGRPAELTDFVAVRLDGHRSHFASWAIPVSLRGGAEFDAVLTIVQERDEIVALTSRLREWEERFRKVAEATGQVVYEWDFATGTVRRTGNQQSVLGFSAEEESLLDALAHWRSRVHPDDRDAVTAAFEQHRAEGTPFDLEYRFRRDERHWIRIHDRGFFERDAGGAVARMIGSMADVTAHRDTEAQLRQAQKMETVGTLAGGIAHDFNNQLTGVLGHLDLLAAALAPDDARLEHVRTAQAAAERCAELTRGLLAFSRRLHGSPEPAALNPTVEEAVRLLRRALPASIRVQTELAADLPTARFDATQLQQVILNLCINARDAMPHGGTLTIGTAQRRLAAGELERPEARAGSWLLLRVRDDGTGISAEVLPRVFEPFFTTKPVGAGTGLGLAMVYGIVSEHGGWIDVNTREGHGSEFTVWLPACEDAPAPTHAPSAANGTRDTATGLGRGELVLVVDDEPVLRSLACRALREHGFRTLEAADAAQGLELASAHAEQLEGVLLDLTMPGMSGAEALPLLRQVAPRAPVVLTSGYSVESAHSLEGAAGFLPKPWAPSEVAAALRRALDSGR